MDCTECGVIERPHVFSGGTDNFIWHFLRLWTNEQFRSWTMATVLLLGGNINFGIMSSIERISWTENYYFSCWNWNASFTNHGLRANSLCIYLCLTQQMPIISIYAQQIHMHSHIFRRIVHKLHMPFARSFNDCWARCEFYYFISQSQNGNGIHSIRASHVFEENAIFDFFGFEFGITMIREWVQFVNNFFLMKRNELITCDPIVMITRRKKTLYSNRKKKSICHNLHRPRFVQSTSASLPLSQRVCDETTSSAHTSFYSATNSHLFLLSFSVCNGTATDYPLCRATKR